MNVVRNCNEQQSIVWLGIYLNCSIWIETLIVFGALNMTMMAGYPPVSSPSSLFFSPSQQSSRYFRELTLNLSACFLSLMLSNSHNSPTFINDFYYLSEH